MNASRAEIFALWKKKIPQVFQKRSRSGDLAARLAAPQSFIDKETRPTFSPPHEFATRKRRRASRSARPKQQSFIEMRQKRKFSQSKKENIRGRQPDLEYEEERERERENEETTTKETLRFHRGEWLRSFEKRRLLDLSQFTGRIRFEGSPSKKVPKSLSPSLSRKDDAKITSTTHRWDKKTKSALEPSFPHPPSSYATNCVLTSPTQVYFTKLLNHRFPEAHYNVFHGCIISTQKEPKSFDGLEILYFFYEI